MCKSRLQKSPNIIGLFYLSDYEVSDYYYILIYDIDLNNFNF